MNLTSPKRTTCRFLPPVPPRRTSVRTLLLALPLCLVALPGPADEHGAAPEDAEIVSWQARYLALGKDVYDWACASCHTTGEQGAPRIGDREAWGERSPLWSAVLLEHAQRGFLEMPAKGGHNYLSDRAVQAAGEYMLGETFPELPQD